MILADLKIYHLRNISFANISLNPRFNYMIGPNGSGKTSILESLYILSCGHSFRTRDIASIVSHDAPMLTIFAKALNEDTFSIQKSPSEPTQIKRNQNFCTSTSQLAYALPCQVFYADIFQIIDAGPAVRRSVLDWGLFHVKHHYLSLLKEYKKVLKQRNALLKTKAPYAHFIPWDLQLSNLAQAIDQLRESYFATWQSTFYNILQRLTSIPCSITYYRGWDKKNNGIMLNEQLADSFEKDKQRQFTHYGTHQADIIIETEESKAKQILSRGQQKIILFALKLAQSALIDSDCIYLIDDFPAELDEVHQKKLLEYFSHCSGQFVITSTAPIAGLNTVDISAQGSYFSIENGRIESMRSLLPSGEKVARSDG